MKHNLVFLLKENNSTPVIVLEILKNSLVVYNKSTKCTETVEYGDVYPIPININTLTNLLRFQASVLSDTSKANYLNPSKITYYSLIIDDKNNLLTITDPETENCTFNFKVNDQNIIIKNNIIKSVHQLQNLINSITNKNMVF